VFSGRAWGLDRALQRGLASDRQRGLRKGPSGGLFKDPGKGLHEPRTHEPIYGSPYGMSPNEFIRIPRGGSGEDQNATEKAATFVATSRGNVPQAVTKSRDKNPVTRSP
jgi:hypothetical protein